MEVQKSVTILENSLKFSHTVKHTPSHGSAIPLFYLSKRNKQISKNMHENTYSGFIQNCCKLGTTEISPEYSLEGLMLKLKLQYFGHLMRRKAGGEEDNRR